VFLAVIALLEIWKRLIPAQSKLAKKIEVTLVILAFVGGASALIRQAISPPIEDKITEALDTGLILEKVMKAAEAKGRAESEKEQFELENEQLKEQLAKAIQRIKKIEAEGNRPDAEKALADARESGDMSGLQRLLLHDRDEHQEALIQRNREIAAVAYLRGDIEIAMNAIDEILKALTEDLFALRWRGHIHMLQGRINEAESDYNRVLKLATDTEDDKARAQALGNLGNIYFRRGDLDKAEEMHRKSLEIKERLGLPAGMANSYGNLGLVYYMRGDLDKAEEMHKKSLEINEKLDQPEGMANQYGNLGNIYYRRGELDKAEEMHKKSLEINEKDLTGLRGWQRITAI